MGYLYLLIHGMVINKKYHSGQRAVSRSNDFVSRLPKISVSGKYIIKLITQKPIQLHTITEIAVPLI